MNNKAFAPIIMLLAIAGLLAVLGGAWYYAVHSTTSSSSIVTVPPPITTTPTPSSTTPVACPIAVPYCPHGSYTVLGSDGCRQTICDPVATSTLITEQQAIQIAANYSKTNLADVQAGATLETSTWDVYFAPKQPANGVMINGGNSEYVIDSHTGAVLSSSLGQ
jgi:hypothetical protein